MRGRRERISGVQLGLSERPLAVNGLVVNDSAAVTRICRWAKSGDTEAGRLME